MKEIVKALNNVAEAIEDNSNPTNDMGYTVGNVLMELNYNTQRIADSLATIVLLMKENNNG